MTGKRIPPPCLKKYAVANKKDRVIPYSGWKLIKFIPKVWATLDSRPAGQWSAGGEWQ